MERKHGSFLLRCWWRNDTVERIEIEHIQSGRRGLLSSVSDALSWIALQREDPGVIGEENAAHTQDPCSTPDRTDQNE
jgi:hypothetical protein